MWEVTFGLCVHDHSHIVPYLAAAVALGASPSEVPVPGLATSELPPCLVRAWAENHC